MTPIMQMVELMMHSGLPCFRGRCHSRCARMSHDMMLTARPRTWLDVPGSYRRGDAEAVAGAVPAASDREGGRRVHARPYPRVIQQLSHEPLRRVPKDAKRHPILEKPCAACAIYILLSSSCTCNKRWLVGEVHKVRCSAPHLQVYYNANIAFCK